MSRAAPSSSSPPPPPPPQVWNVPTDPIGPGPLGRRSPSLFRFTFDFFSFTHFIFPLAPPDITSTRTHGRVHVHANGFCARRRGSRFSAAAEQGRRGALAIQSYAVAARVYSCAVVVVVPVYSNLDTSRPTHVTTRDE